jgi:hypothetical protein
MLWRHFIVLGPRVLQRIGENMETTHGSGYVFKQHVGGFDVPAPMNDG